MNTKIILTATLLTISMAAQAQYTVEARSKSKVVEYDIATCPKMEIGNDQLTFTDGTNQQTFSTEEKVVLYAKNTGTRSLTLVAQDTDETYYATFSSSKPAVFPASVNVQAATVDGTALTLTPLTTDDYAVTHKATASVVGYYVPANTGVLISSADADITYFYAELGQNLKDMPENMLQPASKVMLAEYRNYKLAYGDFEQKTGLGFYWGAEDGGAFTVKDGTAYLAVPASASSAKSFTFIADPEGVERVTDIQGAATYYNLAGQRVTTNTPGIIIYNGKKYIRDCRKLSKIILTI